MSAFRSVRPLAFLVSLAVLALGVMLLTPVRAHAADGVVGTGSPGSCTDTSFDATFYAVQSSGGGVITFKCGAAPHTIILTTQKAVSANTELRGAGLITLSGANATSLFQVYSGQTLTLDRIELTRAYGPAGAVESFGRLVIKSSKLTNHTSTASGGAITSYGELSVSDSILSGNSAGQTGGAIFADGGTATISASQFSDNRATDAGGAIRGTIAASLTINGSQFTGNKVTATFAQGGAIRAEGTTNISQSTFSGNNGSRGGALSVGDGLTKVTNSTMTGNWAAYGGAIRQEGGELRLTDVTLNANGYGSTGTKVTTGGGGLSFGAGAATLNNVTISNNWASYGGGFDHDGTGTTTLTNVTISGNGAVGGGGFDQGNGSVSLVNVTVAGNSVLVNGGGIASRGGTLALKNTLLSGNYKADTGQKMNCNKTLSSASFSLSSDLTCGLGSGRDNVVLALRPLGNNGGPTQTHLLIKGSPAVDTGTGLGCPSTDQRGVARPQATACDVGAVEMRDADYRIPTYLPFVRR